MATELRTISNSTTTPRRILVVDDEPHLVRAVRMYLEIQGYTVFGAHSGEDALVVLREKLPDVVILDVLMPGLDGFETLQEIRRISSVPVIMLTARGEAGWRYVGPDDRGLELDVIAVELDTGDLLVIHAMPTALRGDG